MSFALFRRWSGPRNNWRWRYQTLLVLLLLWVGVGYAFAVPSSGASFWLAIGSDAALLAVAFGATWYWWRVWKSARESD